MDCIAEITEAENIEKIVLQNKNAIKQEELKVHVDKEKQKLKKELEEYKLELDELITIELEGVDVNEKYKELSKKIDYTKNELKNYEEEVVENLTIKTDSRINIAFDEPVVRQLIHKINIISMRR